MQDFYNWCANNIHTQDSSRAKHRCDVTDCKKVCSYGPMFPDIPEFIACYEKAVCDTKETLKCVQDKKWDKWEWKDKDKECVEEAGGDDNEIRDCMADAEDKAGILTCYSYCVVENNSPKRTNDLDVILVISLGLVSITKMIFEF